MSSTKLNPEQVLLLEQDLLRTPLDNLRKLQKTTAKTYEYNMTQLEKELDQVLVRTAKAASSESSQLDPTQRQAVSKSVESMLSRMRGLKRKLVELEKQTESTNQIVKTRLDHLGAVPPTVEHATYPAWAKKRLSHHLVDYMLRASPPLKESARVLAQEENVEDLVDSELWDEMGKVETALAEKKLDEVLSWVGENRTALKKLKSPLEFTIHLQSFIELCRARSLPAAIVYARKNLAPSSLSEFDPPASFTSNAADSTTREQQKMDPMEELKRAMALLAYPPETTCRIYADLYSPIRWSHLRQLFRTTFLTLHSLPTLPQLHMSLQAGLASLKTPTCCPLPSLPTPSSSDSSNESNNAIARNGGTLTISPSGHLILTKPSLPTTTTANAITDPLPPPSATALSTSCPLCTSPLRVLAPSVPYSHHVNSTIVCSITGKVVEGDGGEGGMLVALVSRVGSGGGIAGGGDGRVYSREGLELKASEHPEGKLIEPATGEVFEWSELKKVYIS
ncbi:glucose-induced degradation complex subunit FYV10 [Sporobolomyces salmoneus]|uniref:glucose-induced degradation complex subunit FYV10 n=1 Tax=Sporobolomyces salmoneus TaxID=183962 RepID=UPI00316D4718